MQVHRLTTDISTVVGGVKVPVWLLIIITISIISGKIQAKPQTMDIRQSGHRLQFYVHYIASNFLLAQKFFIVKLISKISLILTRA